MSLIMPEPTGGWHSFLDPPGRYPVSFGQNRMADKQVPFWIAQLPTWDGNALRFNAYEEAVLLTFPQIPPRDRAQLGSRLLAKIP